MVGGTTVEEFFGDLPKGRISWQEYNDAKEKAYNVCGGGTGNFDSDTYRNHILYLTKKMGEGADAEA